MVSPGTTRHHRGMIAFEVVAAQTRDCEVIVQVEFAACAEDPGFSAIFPRGASQETVEKFTRQYEDELIKDPTCHMVIARDANTGDIASFATWYFFGERSWEDVSKEMLNDEFSLPEDANRELGNRLIQNGIRKRHETMGIQAYAFLAAVGTSLGYRRQGAASLLIAWGLKIADERGLPAYVEGTAGAVAVYHKHGFDQIDRLRLEMEPWKEGDFWNSCMVRKAVKGT